MKIILLKNETFSFLETILVQFKLILCMKKTIAIVIAILAAHLCAAAETPRSISYQAYVENAAGESLESGTYSVEFSLFSSATASNCVWTETRTVEINEGVFSVNLGETAPLDLDFSQKYWLGININGSGDASPRVELTSSAYSFFASDIADEAVTVEKIAPASADNSILIWDASSASWTIGERGYSNESGTFFINSYVYADGSLRVGSSTFPEPGNIRFNEETSDFEGYTGEAWLSLTGSSPKWSLSDGAIYSLGDWGIARNNAQMCGGLKKSHVNLGYNSISGKSGESFEYCTISGGNLNEAAYDGATVSGGGANKADNYFASVGGGAYNTASGLKSVVSGGESNTVSGDYGSISGGRGNSADLEYSAVSGGLDNEAAGRYSFVGGGELNAANANYSAVAGGIGNDADRTNSFVGGGAYNEATAINAAVLGGEDNSASGYGSIALGGKDNAASGYYSVVAGGEGNTASGDDSFIAGGVKTILGERSFAFRGGIGSRPSETLDLTSETETFHIADANFYFNYGNEDADFQVSGTQDNLIFADGGTNKVGVGTSSPRERLEVAGAIIIGANETETAGAMRWNGTYFQGYDGSDWLNFGSYNIWDIDGDVIKTAGDWAIARNNATLYGTKAWSHINLGYFSGTGKSGSNMEYCAVSGGISNVAEGDYSLVSGGGYNTASGGYSVVGGGRLNRSSGLYSAISGGSENEASGEGAFVAGGIKNNAAGERSIVAGSHLKIGARSFGFRGGNGINPTTLTDVSGETETFHIVDASFHFNYNNIDKDFRLDGSGSSGTYSLFMDAQNNRIGVGSAEPLEKLHVEGAILIGSTSAANEGALRYNGSKFQGYNGSQWSDLDNSWVVSGSVIYPDSDVGVARYGATLHGTAKSTHANFGVASETGESGSNYAYSAVSGGYANKSSNNYSTVAGGKENESAGENAAIGGGYSNYAGQDAAIAGGYDNRAQGARSAIGGGRLNSANGLYAAVGGGYDNTAYSSYSTVGGGYSNDAQSTNTTIGGGQFNLALAQNSTVGGGKNNSAGGLYSAVGGGVGNIAMGDASVIPGGAYLKVGERSFGFRGGIGSTPSTLLDLSSIEETFHVVDANFYFNYSNQDVDFHIAGTEDNLIYVDASANRVGIGVAPADITHRLTIANDGASDNVIASGYAQYSDSRVKLEQKELIYGLDEILKLSPKSYFHNSSIFSDGKLVLTGESQRTIGLIAQEVYEILPEAAYKPENENVELWRVNYDKIIPVLINAIKRQQEIIESQKNEIDKLSANAKSRDALIIEAFERIRLLESNGQVKSAGLNFDK